MFRIGSHITMKITIIKSYLYFEYIQILVHSLLLLTSGLYSKKLIYYSKLWTKLINLRNASKKFISNYGNEMLSCLNQPGKRHCIV